MMTGLTNEDEFDLVKGIQGLLAKREIMAGELDVAKITNQTLYSKLKELDGERKKERVSFAMLKQRSEDLDLVNVHATYREYSASAELKRKDTIIDQFMKCANLELNFQSEIADAKKMSEQFVKSLQTAPWLPEKRAAQEELKRHQKELGRVQEECAKMDQQIAGRQQHLNAHQKMSFKQFCLVLANYVHKSDHWKKQIEEETVLNAKLEERINQLQQNEEVLVESGDAGNEEEAATDAVADENMDTIPEGGNQKESSATAAADVQAHQQQREQLQKKGGGILRQNKNNANNNGGNLTIGVGGQQQQGTSVNFSYPSMYYQRGMSVGTTTQQLTQNTEEEMDDEPVRVQILPKSSNAKSPAPKEKEQSRPVQQRQNTNTNFLASGTPNFAMFDANDDRAGDNNNDAPLSMSFLNNPNANVTLGQLNRQQEDDGFGTFANMFDSHQPQGKADNSFMNFDFNQPTASAADGNDGFNFFGFGTPGSAANAQNNNDSFGKLTSSPFNFNI